MNRETIESANKFLSKAVDYLDPKEVLRYYFALNQHYQIDQNHMPVPIWRRMGFSDQGTEAWNQIKHINDQIPIDRNLSIYLHVPLCPSRCSFCDCLTRVVHQNVQYTLDEYLESLLKEINAWQHCGGLLKRQVTTVHFGGGTPLFLGYDRFEPLINALKSSFNITPYTEWALETTCRSLNTENLEGLTNLGFRRLHLGVQSMEPDVRPLLKRRETPYRILDKIKAARQLGWIVSVDLLVGLPAETLDGMLDGIEHLIHAGVDGFSIYEINISTQNMAFANQYKLLTRDRRENYWMFVAVVIFLLQQEYSKNLFNHFVNDRDQNLYFTFPLRSEDCLAMGAYADGVFEDYHYRHYDYLETIKTTSTYQPAIQGGIKRPPPMEKLYPIEIALLSGEIAEHQFKRAFSDVETQILLSRWRAALLIEENQSGTYSMTPNGAWFSGNMIQDLHRMAATHG